MKKSLFFLGFIAGLSFACKHGSEHHNHGANDAESAGDNSMDKHGHVNIVLDNGEKWLANPETTEGINTMAAILDAYPADAETVDYRSLKSKLSHEFETIFQKCTMTGEAHEQLHNFLLPMVAMMDSLGSGSQTSCKNAADALRYHLKEYDNYFR